MDETLCTRLARPTLGRRIGRLPQIYNSDVAGGSDQIRLACASIPLFVDPSAPEMTASTGFPRHISYTTPHLAFKQIQLPPSALIEISLSHAALQSQRPTYSRVQLRYRLAVVPLSDGDGPAIPSPSVCAPTAPANAPRNSIRPYTAVTLRLATFPAHRYPTQKRSLPPAENRSRGATSKCVIDQRPAKLYTSACPTVSLYLDSHHPRSDDG